MLGSNVIEQHSLFSNEHKMHYKFKRTLTLQSSVRYILPLACDTAQKDLNSKKFITITTLEILFPNLLNSYIVLHRFPSILE